MDDLRISQPSTQELRPQEKAVEKSTFLGRVVANFESIKDKFESVTNLFKEKVADIKEFFSRSSAQNFVAKPISEEKIASKGEQILGTREPIGLQRSFKTNPSYESPNSEFKPLESREKYSTPEKAGEYVKPKLDVEYVESDTNPAAQVEYANPSLLSKPLEGREKYSAPEKAGENDYADPSLLSKPLEGREKYSNPANAYSNPAELEGYAHPSGLQNDSIPSEGYSRPQAERNSPHVEYVEPDIHPVAQAAVKVENYASNIFNKIFGDAPPSLDLQKADGPVRTYNPKVILGEGNYKMALMADKVKTTFDALGNEIQRVTSRVLLVMNASESTQKKDVDVQAEIKVNTRLNEIAKEGKKSGVNNLSHVVIAKPVTYNGEVAFTSKLMSGGALSSKIAQLDANMKNLVASDMCKGIQELHHNGIVHRDIKADNFLIDERMNVKIADMGKAFMLEDGAHDTATFTPSRPPGVKSATEWDKKADIYQLGVALFQVYSGMGDVHKLRAMMAPELTPEERRDNEKFLAARDDALERGAWEGIENIPPTTRDFILKMLDPDPSKRPDIDEVVAFFG